jgi:hypothetical protein
VVEATTDVRDERDGEETEQNADGGQQQLLEWVLARHGVTLRALGGGHSGLHLESEVGATHVCLRFAATPSEAESFLAPAVSMISSLAAELARGNVFGG